MCSYVGQKFVINILYLVYKFNPKNVQMNMINLLNVNEWISQSFGLWMLFFHIRLEFPCDWLQGMHEKESIIVVPVRIEYFIIWLIAWVDIEV